PAPAPRPAGARRHCWTPPPRPRHPGLPGARGRHPGTGGCRRQAGSATWPQDRRAARRRAYRLAGNSLAPSTVRSGRGGGTRWVEESWDPWRYRSTARNRPRARTLTSPLLIGGLLHLGVWSLPPRASRLPHALSSWPAPTRAPRRLQPVAGG